MTLVQALAPTRDVEMAEAQIAFHLNAGVDLVLVSETPDFDLPGVLEAYERENCLRRLPTIATASEREWRASALRAGRELAADWMIFAAPGEFWWPRGESFGDLLASVPERYGIVQGLVRDVVFQPPDGELFAERMTMRESVGRPRRPGEPSSFLRPMYRVASVLDTDAGRPDEVLVPLRAWYPIEVFRFPSGPTTSGEPDATRDLADGTLVRDERLRDVLRALRRPDGDGRAGAYLLPREAPATLFARPSIVEDAAHAVECAEVREVDLESLEQQINELGRRLSALEHPLWPRVRRRLARLVGR